MEIGDDGDGVYYNRKLCVMACVAPSWGKVRAVCYVCAKRLTASKSANMQLSATLYILYRTVNG